MRFSALVSAAVGAGLLLPSLARTAPHGGLYRGPGNVVPGNGPSDTARCPGGAAPSAPTSAGSSGSSTSSTPESSSASPTPPPTGAPARASRGRRRAMGVSVQSTEGEWQIWWEFNRDRFLGLKRAIYSIDPLHGDGGVPGRRGAMAAPEVLMPSDKDRERIAQTMIEVLRQDVSRDVTSSALIGLAKVDSSGKSLKVFREFLRKADQEKRETAALAMGISGNVDSVEILLDLAGDTEAGRAHIGRKAVDYRTRSFACYALGLICQGSADQKLQAKAFFAMRDLLDRAVADRDRRDLCVAPIQAMRMLRPTPDLRNDIVSYLLEFAELDDETVYANIRSHAYVAVAKLLGRDAKRSGHVAQLMASRLADRKQRSWVHQSSIIALGKIAGTKQHAVSESLRWYLDHGRDFEGRGFAAIALGEVGGTKNRAFLLQQMRKGKKMLRPWIAIGLGVLDFDRQTVQGKDPDPVIGATIHKEFLATKNQIAAAGLAIALGICRYRDAGDDIVTRLDDSRHQTQAAGYMAVSLGLLRHRDALTVESIKQLLEQSRRRPYLLGKCAIALGLLGDKQIAVQLAGRIREQHTVAVYGALASGLGAIGDRRSIEPLIAMAKDEELRALPRAFAVVALGLVGDTRPMPWNADLAIGNNYRANVETLTGGQAGVLDIL